MKQYSRLNELPCADALNTVTSGCLLLAGGGWKCVYTQGVLDALMTAGINFSCTVGVSGGALMAVNYLSGQIGRGPYITLKYRHDTRFVGWRAVIENHGISGFRFMHETAGDLYPLNNERFYDPARRLICAAANCLDGHARYFEKGKDLNFLRGMQAGATVPFASRAVMIDGVPYLDGGLACSIPLEYALTQNYSKNIVVLTQERSCRNLEEYPAELCRTFYHRYPAICERLQHANAAVNRTLDQISRMESAGTLFVLAPSKKMDVSLFCGDMEKLGELYHLGWQDTEERIPALLSYLRVKQQN